MRETLRTRMGWLHAWTGLVGGLLLVCIFATGSLSVFDAEITRWMQPEVQVQPETALTPAALDIAARMIEREYSHGVSAFLILPSARSPTLQVLHYDGRGFVGTVLDPGTGAVIPARQTQGGELFFRFHYTLCLPGPMGILAVNLLGVGLLVALVSGLVIHIRALVPDIVLLRLHATRLRAWLDTHLLAGVLVLPFMLMITYTGVLANVDTLLPARSVASFWAHAAPHMQPPVVAPAQPPRAFTSLPPLAPLLATACTRLGGREAGFILFSPDQLSIFVSDGSGPFLTRDHADFSLPEGAPQPVLPNSTGIAHATQLMHGLHYARFAPIRLRWLYFASGLCATAVIASGLVLFFMKRRRDWGHTPAFRIGEGLPITALAGLPSGICALLWANRLLPATLPGRDGHEVTICLAVWGLCALHAVLRSIRGRSLPAWREELALTAFLAGGLPFLDGLTAPCALRAVPAVHMAVDGMGLSCAAIALYARTRAWDRGG